MANTPFSPERDERRRPPRFDRLQELASFWLGYEPHHLWHDFIFRGLRKPDPECGQRLLDLPVLLAQFFDPYSTIRFHAAFRRFRRLFSKYPARSGEGRQKIAEDDGRKEYVTLRNDPIKGNAGKANQIGSGTNDDEVFSGIAREELTLVLTSFGIEPSVFALIRLAKAIGNHLPDHLNAWFEFGRVTGHCLFYFAPQLFRTEIDVAQDIRIAASRTDFRREGIPGLSHADYGRQLSLEESCWGSDYSYWVLNRVEELVLHVQAYLEDDPCSVFDSRHHHIWFLGCFIELTASESKVLETIVHATEKTISREAIVAMLGDSAVPGEDIEMNTHKADKYVQSIIDKITTALEAAKSSYFRENRQSTNSWLREKFIKSVPKVGWQRGHLLSGMVVR